jgi:peptidoglycan/LPS O-acetylase OafA/YrhL
LPRPPVWLGLAAFAVGVEINRHLHAIDPLMADLSWHSFLSDLGTALGFCVLTVSFATAGRRLPGARLHQWAADFSYSTYLVHFPFVVLTAPLVVHLFGLQLAGEPSPQALALIGGVTGLALAYSLAFSRVTEIYTPRVRETLQRTVEKALIGVGVRQAGSS